MARVFSGPALPGIEGILPLEPGDLDRLRPVSANHRDELESALLALPGRSVWLPASLEYAVLAPWRRRTDIAVIHELNATGSAEALVHAAAARADAMGDCLVLMLDMDEQRAPGFYHRAGMEPLEAIVTYDLLRHAAPDYKPGRLRFERANPFDPALLQALIEIDNRAFPWLWWNTTDEFLLYHHAPGVQMHIGFLNDEPVSYFGVTSYLGWGHLDRIAVDPLMQGYGLGQETLGFAIKTLLARGANRIALSTQASNARSRRLYEATSFRRSPAHDYQLYGVRLRPPATDLVAIQGEPPVQ